MYPSRPCLHEDWHGLYSSQLWLTGWHWNWATVARRAVRMQQHQCSSYSWTSWLSARHRLEAPAQTLHREWGLKHMQRHFYSIILRTDEKGSFLLFKEELGRLAAVAQGAQRLLPLSKEPESDCLLWLMNTAQRLFWHAHNVDDFIYMLPFLEAVMWCDSIAAFLGWVWHSFHWF